VEAFLRVEGRAFLLHQPQVAGRPILALNNVEEGPVAAFVGGGSGLIGQHAHGAFHMHDPRPDLGGQGGPHAALPEHLVAIVRRLAGGITTDEHGAGHHPVEEGAVVVMLPYQPQEVVAVQGRFVVQRPHHAALGGVHLHQRAHRSLGPKPGQGQEDRQRQEVPEGHLYGHGPMLLFLAASYQGPPR
jgi:hypothetical protein